MYIIKILAKEFISYKDAIDFVNKVKKGKPCDTEGESPCKACLKGCCSSLDDENLYEMMGLTITIDNKYLLTYVKND